MARWLLLLVSALLLPAASGAEAWALGAPSAGPAGQAEDSAWGAEAAGMACAWPPCGWILPVLDFDVPDKLPCGGGRILYSVGPPDDCFEMLQPGETRVYPAKFVMKWEITDEGTYPKEIGTDIVISFSGTGGNVPWIALDIAGENMTDGTYRLDDAALVDPDNLRRITTADGRETVWFWFERAIEISFSRDGGPSTQELRELEGRQGVMPYFLKARSSDSGPRFKEGFGIEEFRFNTCTDDAIAASLKPCPAPAGTAFPVDQDAPAPAWTLALAALLAVVMLRRR